MPMVKIRVTAYEAHTDVFSIEAFGFGYEDQELDPDYCRDAPDFDDFEVPGIVMPALIGRFEDGASLVNKVFTIPARRI